MFEDDNEELMPIENAPAPSQFLSFDAARRRLENSPLHKELGLNNGILADNRRTLDS